jgi:hypothetical protein
VKVPRVQFTIRRLMIAVALMALVAGLFAGLERRRLRLLDVARVHADPIRVMTAETDIDRPEWQWHFAMYAKYSQAARRPWLPLAPDPPEPK